MRSSRPRRTHIFIFDTKDIRSPEFVYPYHFGHVLPLENGNVVRRLPHKFVAGRAGFDLGCIGGLLGQTHMAAFAIMPNRPQPVGGPIPLRPAFNHDLDHKILMETAGTTVKLALLQRCQPSFSPRHLLNDLIR